MKIELNLTKEEVCRFLDFLDEGREYLSNDYYLFPYQIIKADGVREKLNVARKVKRQIIGMTDG